MKDSANIMILSMARQEILILNLLYPKELLISVSLDTKLIDFQYPKHSISFAYILFPII